jgi:SpoVK/Ycf46/Vps4 family AAA+-type ATPase
MVPPVHPGILGSLYSLGSRAIRGEIGLDDDTQETISKVRDELEDVSELVGDFSPTQPGTWPQFAGRVMDRAFESCRHYESAEAWRDIHGFAGTLALPDRLIRHIARTGRTETVFEGDDRLLRLIALPDSPPVCLATDAEKSLESHQLYYAPQLSGKSRLRRAMADVYWRGRSAVLMSFAGNDYRFEEFDLSDHVYRGDELELIDRLREFRREGIRRNVLLQGPPGCGKTTFCCHAARELSDRTLLLGPDALGQLRCEPWKRLVETLQPELVIVEDVDHTDEFAGRDGKNRALRLFEEQYCDIPTILFTSNDHSKLPEAMRRPGRIDSIVRFEEPSDDMRQHIVDKLAERVGVEVPDHKRGWLVDLLDEYSTAHVLEALRRARVRGWDQDMESEEATFRMHRNFETSSEWLKIHGFRHLDVDAEYVFQRVFNAADPELVFDGDHSRLWRVELPNGTELCLKPHEHETWDCVQTYYRPEHDGREAFVEGFAEAFWRDAELMLMDSVEHETICRPLDHDDQCYHGDLTEMIEVMEAFREDGLRRNVLLQGPPGTGKTTFCLHAARELSERTLMLTPEFYNTIRCATWRHLTELLKPEMVIVDDVDRVAEHALEQKLRLFEENYCEIPFVLLTSNDIDRLPRPMKRPGRIDQILEVGETEEQVRWNLIRNMADRVGVEVPDQELKRLDEILHEQSPAHLLEALRRARVLGWESDLLPDQDVTFETIDEDGESDDFVDASGVL